MPLSRTEPWGRSARRLSCKLLRLMCDAIRHESVNLVENRSPNRQESVEIEPLRILIAEDSVDNRKLVQVYLKGSPHRLIFAEDGRSAVDLFSAGNFDLILMDMQMPVMDGLTATRTIRAIEQERHSAQIPIIALTANARRQDVELIRSAGCNEHLSKPISKHTLLSAIAAYGPKCQLRWMFPKAGLPNP